MNHRSTIAGFYKSLAERRLVLQEFSAAAISFVRECADEVDSDREEDSSYDARPFWECCLAIMTSEALGRGASEIILCPARDRAHVYYLVNGSQEGTDTMPRKALDGLRRHIQRIADNDRLSIALVDRHVILAVNRQVTEFGEQIVLRLLT